MTDETLFHEAIAKPRAERAAFLAVQCRGNPELRAAVDALLTAHEASGEFLDKPPAAVSQTGEVPPVAEAHLGTFSVFKEGSGPETVIANRYTLLEKVGEGGMGEVWVAKQTEPIKRKVALKLIKKGMDSKAVLSRFEQERQALAIMDHPNIARVLDGGMTPSGQPFFVMELVNGFPLTKYCDETKLTPRQRLELFVPICHAVQHAHQKGIVHRDLKPANILITEIDGKPVPKVIDFGVAKATHGKLTDESMFTHFGAVVGTLEYMAPEQAGRAGEDIDTRADIYSLGVILYELLTGLKPIDATRLKNTAMLEMIRVIKEEEPPRPSTRLSTDKSLPALAASRQTEPHRLMAMLRGELDWVVMKCLEKSRNRRYETVNGLAADIGRYLSNEPVIARPQSAAYRLQKFWQRNRLACSAALTVAAALLIGIVASVYEAARAEREAARAISEQARAVAALDELRATAPTYAAQARLLAVGEQFIQAVDKLDYAIKLRPDAAEYLVAKGDLLQCQLKLADAAAIYREALSVQPGLTRAEASATLCDELLAAKPDADGTLSRDSLGKLFHAMQRQQRPAAELIPVGRRLGEKWLRLLHDSGVKLNAYGQLGDGTWEFNFEGTAIRDLSILRGAPITRLWLTRTAVSTLEPLRGMGLRWLHMHNTKVTDLGPLKGMPLDYLLASRNKISDLSVLRGMPLVALYLNDCPEITDLSPLEDCKELQYIVLPPNAKNFEFLRALPLIRIGFKDSGPGGNPDKTAAEFWKEYDAKKQ